MKEFGFQFLKLRRLIMAGYLGPLGVEHPGQNLGEGFSPEIWGQSHLLEIQADKEAGWYFEDRFTEGKNRAGVYQEDNATSGTWADSLVDVGGWGIADSGAVTAAQGINIQMLDLGFIIRTGAIICCEMIFRLVDATSGLEFFWGLCNSNTTILSGSTWDSSSTDHIGMHILTDDLVMLNIAEKAGTISSTGVTYQTITSSQYSSITSSGIGSLPPHRRIFNK